MLLSDLDKAALDLPAVPGPGLPAVELEDGAVLLHEGDEVVLHRVVQVRGLPEESDHEYRCSLCFKSSLWLMWWLDVVAVDLITVQKFRCS